MLKRGLKPPTRRDYCGRGNADFRNGLDAARLIRQQAPNIKFIFLTAMDDPNLAAATLELGPIGFVLKQSSGGSC